MLSDTLTELLVAVDRSLETLGWDRPALLCWVHLDGDQVVDGLPLRLEPAAALDGNPVCDLVRRHLVAPQEAVGAALVSEAWAYGPTLASLSRSGVRPGVAPADDPDRVEVRIAELVLRDGTEVAVARPRGGTAEPVGDRSDSMVTMLLRRTVGVASHAPVPDADLGTRVALLWQISSLLVLAGHTGALPRPDDSRWGTFDVPGLGAPSERDPWWPPFEAWAAGDRDRAALATAVRTAARSGAPCLAGSFPLVRDGDEVVAGTAALEWFDDELLCEFLDATVPSVGTVVDRAMDVLDDAPLASLLAWVNGHGAGGG